MVYTDIEHKLIPYNRVSRESGARKVKKLRNLNYVIVPRNINYEAKKEIELPFINGQWVASARWLVRQSTTTYTNS